ncbi:hypothetical protein SUGI_0856140 [Cryptomeria japonica]|nr:hypothetical protein SUGI_0856140 [Cryptomeria japonica]
MPPKASAVLTKEVRLVKEGQYGMLVKIAALEATLRITGVSNMESDSEEEEVGEQGNEAPQNVPQEEQLGPEEKTFLAVLKAVKGDHSDMKLDLPMYGGKMDNEEVLDWMDSIDNYFDFKEVLEDQKVKLAKTKLKGSTLTW